VPAAFTIFAALGSLSLLPALICAPLMVTLLIY
jgi:hypothetical protein